MFRFNNQPGNQPREIKMMRWGRNACFLYAIFGGLKILLEYVTTHNPSWYTLISLALVIGAVFYGFNFSSRYQNLLVEQLKKQHEENTVRKDNSTEKNLK